MATLQNYKCEDLKFEKVVMLKTSVDLLQLQLGCMVFGMHSLLLSSGTIVLLASKKTVHYFNPSDSKLQVI